MKTILVIPALVFLETSTAAQTAPAPTQTLVSTVRKDERAYAEGLVTLVANVEVEYGHFDEYIDWLNSTWKPTMEATKKAGLIIDYKVFSLTPTSPGQPNVILRITYKNMAGLDKGGEEEEVSKKIICSADCQNKARVSRNKSRKVLGYDLLRELILK